MKATVMQRPEGSFAVVIMDVEAERFRFKLRGEGMTIEETVKGQEGKKTVAFAFGATVAIEDVQKLLEDLGYDCTTQQVD
jgi:hypothetical protein